jgi:Zn-finger nucleic acid-binding protein
MVLMGSLAFAQNAMFTCSSDDMGYHTCRVGPNSGIQFVRQRSDSACVSGRTYGIARDGVWVDRGCRADFQVTQNGYYNNGQYSRQGAWRDRDGDGDYDADDQYHEHHRHHRDRDYGAYNNPYNNSPYAQGGYVNSGQPIQYLGRYHGDKSTCSTQPGQGQTFCQTGGPFRDAYLTKENGQNPCIRGRNWNVDPNLGLWTADGCSGEFKIEK